MPEDYDFDAAIVHHNRVCEINLLHLTSSQLQRLASAMQEQFPALIHLMLGFFDYSGPAISGSSRWVLRWICPTSAISQVAFHSIPCASETSFVRN
jgi:hypothetical protein